MLDNPEEYAALKDKEKDWMSVRFGYFVLLSNRKLEPVDLLTEYFGKTDIEGVIKTSKEYLGLLRCPNGLSILSGERYSAT